MGGDISAVVASASRRPRTFDVLIGAYDVISRIFGQGAVINAYYRTDPDTMDMRAEDDDFLKHVKFFGYDDQKED